MPYKITAEADYLRAVLSGRQTVEETHAFLLAAVREKVKHRRPCVLIVVRVSTPVFQVAANRLLESIADLAPTPLCRVALVGDTRDLQMSHEYIELLARQRELNVRSFRDETAALKWFKDQRRKTDRRQRSERRASWDRRRVGDRRGGRGGAGAAIPEPAQ
ncbi:MAG TPA: hypothetical protein VKD25_04695 [Burkholderiales bacterium]|nr:hypothetical protein [Burkholderiales bacterium]